MDMMKVQTPANNISFLPATSRFDNILFEQMTTKTKTAQISSKAKAGQDTSNKVLHWISVRIIFFKSLKYSDAMTKRRMRFGYGLADLYLARKMHCKDSILHAKIFRGR